MVVHTGSRGRDRKIAIHLWPPCTTWRDCFRKLKTKQTKQRKRNRVGKEISLRVCTVGLLLEKFLDAGVGIILLVPQLLATGLLMLKAERGG